MEAWVQHQHVARASKAQLSLAAQYHASAQCVSAVRWWKSSVDDDRRTRTTALAVQTASQEKRKRIAVLHWLASTSLQRKVRRVQQRTSHPVFVVWRRSTVARRHDRVRALSLAWRLWRDALRERSQWTSAVKFRAARDRIVVARAFRCWRADHGAHTAVFVVGERVRDARKRRQTQRAFGEWRLLTAAVHARLLPLTSTADSFYHMRLLSLVLEQWRHACVEAVEHGEEMEESATALRRRTLTRRVLDVWAERAGERMKARHLQSRQAVRLSIVMRSYHTSLLLHTFSQWRAAAAAVMDRRGPSLPPASALRLTSVADVRRFIDEQRTLHGRPMAQSSFPSSRPTTPMTSTSTESASPSSASEAAQSSRPSTVESVELGGHSGKMERVGLLGVRARGGLSVHAGVIRNSDERRTPERTSFPRMNMRDL